MEILLIFGAFGALIIALLVYVGLRDRRRLSSADDTAASLKAAADAHRHTADSQTQQSARMIRDQIEGHG